LRTAHAGTIETNQKAKKMPHETPVKKCRDGSIDTGYYIKRGRKMRSEAAHDMARTVRQGAMRRVLRKMAAAPALILART
jgi:hypothetical protein